MQVLSHSPFLQALGYAIANSLWQIALLWLIVIVFNGLFRFSAAAKYRIALLAQFSGFAWFIVTLQYYYEKCTEAVKELMVLHLNTPQSFFIVPQTPSVRSGLMHWLVKAEQLLPFLSLAYLFLLVFLTVKWGRSYYQAQRIRTTGLQRISGEWQVFVQKIALQLNIQARVKVCLSTLVNSPLTVGYLKPIILIPVASINHLTTEQMEAVILHELAHIKRADYIINLLQSVVEIALFFNPFTQLLSKVIRKERENSCDDWVLQFQYNPSMYAEALLSIAYLQRQPVLAMPVSGSTKGDLLPRVKRMLNQQEKSFHYKRHLAALLLMTGILTTAAWLPALTESDKAAAKTESNTGKRPLVIEPVASKIDNPLFNPVFFLSKTTKEKTSPVASRKRENKQHDTVVTVSQENDAAHLSAVAPIAVQQHLQTVTVTATPEEAATIIVETPQPVMAIAAPGIAFTSEDNVVKTTEAHRKQKWPSREFRAEGMQPPAPMEASVNLVYSRFLANAMQKARRQRFTMQVPTLPVTTRSKQTGGQPMAITVAPAPPPPVMVNFAPPTAARIMEKMLSNGSDSLNQALVITMVHAKNTADSMNILRLFYRQLVQQLMMQHRREQQDVDAVATEEATAATPAAPGKKDNTHFTFRNPVYIENNGATIFSRISKPEKDPTPSQSAGPSNSNNTHSVNNTQEMLSYEYHDGEYTIIVSTYHPREKRACDCDATRSYKKRNVVIATGNNRFEEE